MKLQKLGKSSCICTDYKRCSQARLSLDFYDSLFREIFIPWIQPAEVSSSILPKYPKDISSFFMLHYSSPFMPISPSRVLMTYFMMLSNKSFFHLLISAWRASSWECLTSGLRTWWETSHMISHLFKLLSHVLVNMWSFSLKHLISLACTFPWLTKGDAVPTHLFCPVHLPLTCVRL